ncbi:MAG TPA: putative zinc-binding protein [Methanocorpusculum sp.]|nr:putative zinc-binding protein [Methanocorpusculum sp.]
MKEIVLITCSGVSNTGKLTDQAAKYFVQKFPGTVDLLISAKNIADIDDIEREDTNILVLEGCSEGCVMKKLASRKIEPDARLQTTDFGVVKHGMDEPGFADIVKISDELKKSIDQL